MLKLASSVVTVLKLLVPVCAGVLPEDGRGMTVGGLRCVQLCTFEWLLLGLRERRGRVSVASTLLLLPLLLLLLSV